MDKTDKELKALIQQDKVISPKAEKIFNDFISENITEKNTIIVDNRTKVIYKIKKIIAIVTCIAGLLGGANVYASTNGYGNVFFLIKYMVTGEKTEVTNTDLLSDRDIILSYKPISLTENLEIQIRNLQIKENNANLKIEVNEKKNTTLTPLNYKILNAKEKTLCEQESSKRELEKEYSEEIVFNGITTKDEIIKLYIYTCYNTNLAKITINLQTREIIVDDEKEALEKISEIELKKYLSQWISDKYKKSQKEKIVLNINDISYCAGLYKADINYVFINSDNTFEVDYDSIESYALTAYFKSNKNNSTDMFSIVKLEENNTK